MKKFNRMMFSFVLGFMIILPLTVQAEGKGSIKIESPKNGEVIKGGRVVLKWKQEKAGKGNHVHVIVDKGTEKPAREGNSKVLKLEKGEHEITVKSYSEEHNPLPVEDTIKIKVE